MGVVNHLSCRWLRAQTQCKHFVPLCYKRTFRSHVDVILLELAFTSHLRETVNSFDYSLNNHHWISPTNYNINGRISSVSKSTLKRTFESPTGGFDNGLRFLSFCTLSFSRCVCAFMRRPMQRIATAAPSRDCTHDANARGVVNRESYVPVCYSESFEIVLHESNRTLCRQICRSDISSQQPQNNGLSDHREQIPLQELTNKPKLLYNTTTLSSENSWRLCKHWKVFVNVDFYFILIDFAKCWN